MAVTKAKKIEQAEQLSNELKGVNSGIVAEFGKLTVEMDFELRKAVRNAGGKYRVVKGTPFEASLKDLAGRTSIAYTKGDIVALAKALTKYAKDNPELTFKSGVVDGRAIAAKEINALASLPSKEELYSKILFLINAPAQRLVTAINAVPRKVAVVIDQAVKEKKFKEDAGQ